MKIVLGGNNFFGCSSLHSHQQIGQQNSYFDSKKYDRRVLIVWPFEL